MVIWTFVGFPVRGILDKEAVELRQIGPMKQGSYRTVARGSSDRHRT